MVRRRLGLDLGSNSIGWALFDLDKHNDPVSVFKTGVRIFNDGRDPKSLSSLKATRREHRSSRRRRDRFLQRQKTLMNKMIAFGLMPKDSTERRALVHKDPYLIRRAALQIEMSPYEIGRALFHINQRRGFKSSRKSGDNEAGVVKKSVAEFEQNLMAKGASTVGEFLAERREKKEPVLARRTGDKAADLYEFYPQRSMLEEEVNKIWEKQKSHNPKLFSDDNLKAIKDIIFFQRDLKPQEVGRCQFIPEEFRAAKALPSFQRFRIYQEIHNLQYIDNQGVGHPIVKLPKVRDAFAAELENKKKVTFAKMRSILKQMGVVDTHVKFNLESDLRDHLVGNLTSVLMREPKNMLGDFWDTYSEEEQDNFISTLIDSKIDDEEASRILRDTYKVPDDRIESCLDARLPDGYGSLSSKAITQILDIMIHQGLLFYDAVGEAGFEQQSHPDGSLEKLEYYGKALHGHVMNASGKEEDSEEKRYGVISNPTVHIALNQVRVVMNELIRLYGKPEEVVLELARDLPLGADGKRELEKNQRKNLERNESARKELEALKLLDNRDNRQKYQLWLELSSDPTERRCPFTGNVISVSDLYSDKVEVEHLLPYSATLDDSMGNKTLCFREANREKGNRSPHEAFGNSPKGYDWEEIWARAQNLPGNKRWRFLPGAMKKFDEEGGFLERQLNDTRYISRYTKEYLETIVPRNKIWVATGRLTSLLRGKWGLNSILRGHNEDAEKETKKKKLRDDHRHHAIDAVVVGMSSRGMVQKVSRAAKSAEDKDLETLFADKIDPWDGFRDEVSKHINDIIVSHRPRKKIQGSLHNETAYGITEYSSSGPSIVVHRVPIETLKTKDKLTLIRDPLIQEALLKETDGKSGADFEKAVTDWCSDKGIRSLRIEEKISIIPIKDKIGKVYKGYKGDGNAYMEIFNDPNTKKWTGEIVSRFHANQKDYIPEWRKKYPAEKLVMRLRINDTFSIDKESSQQLLRIQKLSGTTIVTAPLNEANVNTRDGTKDDPFNYSYFSPLTLQKANARMVFVSPTGLVNGNGYKEDSRG